MATEVILEVLDITEEEFFELIRIYNIEEIEEEVKDLLG